MSTNTEKAVKVLSLLSNSEARAIHRGMALADALDEFGKLGPHQQSLAAAMVRSTGPTVELRDDGTAIYSPRKGAKP